MTKIEDRELLELAAKAYWPDDEASFHFDKNEDAIIYIHADNQDHNGLDCERVWNPLDDDGDALRLAVKLELYLAIGPGDAMAGDRACGGWGPYESYGNDPCAATRRAIVRAAAEIGRTK